jgi:hypothetical protein
LVDGLADLRLGAERAGIHGGGRVLPTLEAPISNLEGLGAEPDRLGPGGYVQGHSKDLGGIFQFRTELWVAYQFDGGARLGARIAHLSNAGIHHSNPGEEELLVTYAPPFP